MNKQHRQQLEVSVASSLRTAGILDRYHSKAQTLSELSAGGSDAARQALEWFNAHHHTPDAGLCVYGGVDAEDIAVITAKAFHLTGRRAFVCRIVRFFELLSEDRDWLEEKLDSAHVLVLLQAGPNKPNEQVFTDRELRRIEGRVDDWLGSGGRLLMHAKMRRPTFFSADLMQRVALANTAIEVA